MVIGDERGRKRRRRDRIHVRPARQELAEPRREQGPQCRGSARGRQPGTVEGRSKAEKFIGIYLAAMPEAARGQVKWV
jgi:hypothetical protein